MKHRVKGKKLNRTSNHRKALFKNLLANLFLNREITTTETKAKIVKRLGDKFITKAKAGDLHHRRLIHAYFNNKQVTHTLVDQIAPQLTSRQSGFTKLVRLGKRRGDDSMMAKVTFTDPLVITPPTPNTSPSSSQKTISKPSKASKLTSSTPDK